VGDEASLRILEPGSAPGGRERQEGPASAPTPAAPALLAAGATLAAAAATVWVFRALLLPFLLAAVLAYLLAPAVQRLAAAGVPRPWAILLCYLGLAVLAAAFVALVLPDLVAELEALGRAVPALGVRVEAHLARVRAGYERLPLPPGLRAAVDAAVARATRDVEATIRQTTAGLLGWFRVLFAVALAPVLTYYALADLPRMKAGLARLLPPAARQPVLACLADLDRVLAGFVRGELLTALAVGILAAVAAAALRLRFAVTLGLVAALGELVPYLGPVLGAVPALAVAAVQGGLPLVVETGLAYLAVQQIESVVLAPRIVGSSVGLHPLLTVAVLLAGEHVGGLGGLVFAVPAAACLRVLGRHGVRALTALREPRRLA
jgi:predicted PurR-regulated permease PerM